MQYHKIVMPLRRNCIQKIYRIVFHVTAALLKDHASTMEEIYKCYPRLEHLPLCSLPFIWKQMKDILAPFNLVLTGLQEPVSD